MKKILSIILISATLYACSSGPDDQKKKDEAAAAATTDAAKPAEPPATEIGDPSLLESSKAAFEAMHNKDIDAFAKNYADDVVYRWNNFDSLKGKDAVVKYWKDRFATVLDSISFSNQIWLPVKVNKPQGLVAPGNWIMTWYVTTAKYKNGKSMSQWIHNTMHLNSEGKVDQILQFRDQAPIMAATKK